MSDYERRETRWPNWTWEPVKQKERPDERVAYFLIGMIVMAIIQFLYRNWHLLEFNNPFQ